ncbi:hypothetical protein C0995_000402 [Termitomyces sp. Mi166|nr:hypothetical protein C0995_000402 [Termitomyces sp. Mi166\
MLNVSSINGPIVVAMMIDFALFGIICSQTAYYFRIYPKDHWLLKILVIVCFITESAHAVLLADTVLDFYIMSKMPERTAEVFNVPVGAAIAITLTVHDPHIGGSEVRSYYLSVNPPM